jgi:HlyD family secretion protein
MTSNELYRPAALSALKTPDQLGRTLHLVRPARIWTASMLAVLIGGALVASAIVHVPIFIKATGVIISSKGVLEIPVAAQHEGRVVDVLVNEGDVVAPDDVVARIELPELRAEFALAEADRRRIEIELQQVGSLQAEQKEAVRDLHAQSRAEADRSMGLLSERLSILKEMREGVEKLRDRGYATVDRTMQIRADHIDTEERIASKRASLLNMALEERSQTGQFTREMLALQARLAAADQQLARLRQQLERELVRSWAYGIVSDVKVSKGDLVRFDTPIVSLLPTDRTFTGDRPGASFPAASLFVPASEGKKVRAGMKVMVDPRSVRRDVFGNMTGRVKSVSEVPATMDRMHKMLGNDALARQLSQEGAPFLVQVILDRDRANPSGFAWTSSKGPAFMITTGTIASADIEVERVTLLSLVVPALRELLRFEPGRNANVR